MSRESSTWADLVRGSSSHFELACYSARNLPSIHLFSFSGSVRGQSAFDGSVGEHNDDTSHGGSLRRQSLSQTTLANLAGELFDFFELSFEVDSYRLLAEDDGSSVAESLQSSLQRSTLSDSLRSRLMSPSKPKRPDEIKRFEAAKLC